MKIKVFLLLMNVMMALSAQGSTIIINPLGLGGFEQITSANQSITGTPFITGTTGTATTAQWSYTTYQGTIQSATPGTSAGWFNSGVGGNTLALSATNNIYQGAGRGIVGITNASSSQLPAIDTAYTIAAGDSYHLSLAYAQALNAVAGDAFTVVLAYGTQGQTSIASLVTLDSVTFVPSLKFNVDGWNTVDQPIVFDPVTDTNAVGKDLYLYFTVGKVSASLAGTYGDYTYTGNLANNRFLTFDSVSLTAESVPEPSSATLILGALAGLGLARGRKHRHQPDAVV